jgi:hypothetical protein
MSAYQLFNTYTGDLIEESDEHPFRNLKLYHHGNLVWLYNAQDRPAKKRPNRRGGKQSTPLMDVLLVVGALIVGSALLVAIAQLG